MFNLATHINTPDYFFKNGSRHRIITDHLGSVRLVVAPFDGAVLQRIDYDDLGGVILDTNPGYQMYGFAGGIYLRHSGLVKFGARMYDAHSGRWLTKDPILFDGGDTNLYGYTLQDPVNLTDPNGKFAGEACIAMSIYKTLAKIGELRAELDELDATGNFKMCGAENTMKASQNADRRRQILRELDNMSALTSAYWSCIKPDILPPIPET